jgi:hypothetical protein
MHNDVPPLVVGGPVFTYASGQLVLHNTIFWQIPQLAVFVDVFVFRLNAAHEPRGEAVMARNTANCG